ncbi:hypothetical protein L2E82_07359 [Cichorium intybus]|uniref:Uncharacterized protein n=1 Tax=Cichorium intybus TaxID=13427 RepID=A0ACB9G4W4_CICIN|nr:hypothetical protein L2E82_07359 [Cichorium intybus]
MEIPSIPPKLGFEPLTSYSLKRVDNIEVTFTSSIPMSASDSQTEKKEPRLDFSNDEDVKKYINHRLWVNHGRIDSSYGDEYDSKQNQTSGAQLPKGVARGCEDCSNCQKVIARWHPDEARMADLLEAPVFHPSEIGLSLVN